MLPGAMNVTSVVVIAGVVINQGLPWWVSCKESACRVGDLGGEDSVARGKATHSSFLTWRVPWTV